jgi:hypothetical protein
MVSEESVQLRFVWFHPQAWHHTPLLLCAKHCIEWQRGTKTSGMNIGCTFFGSYASLQALWGDVFRQAVHNVVGYLGTPVS